MKVHYFMLVWFFLSISLSPQLCATTPVLNKLLEMHQRQATQPISPAELRQELAQIGLDSPRQVHEITRLLHHPLPEDEFQHQLERVLRRADFDRNPHSESFSGSNISTPDNRPLTGPEQSVLTAVLEDFQVNENVGGCDQEAQEVSMNKEGKFLVVWIDYRDVDSDIYGQLYDSLGNPIGRNFKVNSDSGRASPRTPAVTADGLNNFIVVWNDFREDYGIYAQRYDSEGNALGENFKVKNDKDWTNLNYPRVAADYEGNFVVVWHD